MKALQRKEARYTGVYLLLGENHGETWLYIGEGEDISERIRNHDTGKDWWTTAVLIVSAANSLNKAHVKYLEARLIEIAGSVKRSVLQNSNTPSLPSLSEAASANMETFLQNILMVLPAVRVDALLERRKPDQTIPALERQIRTAYRFELYFKKEDIRATAVLRDGEMIVEKGSQARLEWVGDRTERTSYWKLHDELVRDGTLALHGRVRRFTSDCKFTSTSAAAAIITGRSSSGPASWKLAGTNKSYAEWEAEMLASQVQ